LLFFLRHGTGSTGFCVVEVALSL